MLVLLMMRWACWRLCSMLTYKVGSRSRDWGGDKGLLEVRSDTSRSLEDDRLLGTLMYSKHLFGEPPIEGVRRSLRRVGSGEAVGGTSNGRPRGVTLFVGVE